MKKKPKIILTSKEMNIAIDRLCYQLIEHYNDFSNTCILGIQYKGALLAERIFNRLHDLSKNIHLEFGKLDITFSRDDFKSSFKNHQSYPTEINFLIESKNVILVDDVLYTGRTIQAALQEIQSFGRPSKTELLVLVDRRFNRQVPIQADYCGIRVDALDNSYVKVDWIEEQGSDRVLFYEEERI
ncbi:MAG: bifunctional pyr operon transcriptional regulator/uracil phosphoribosyltransferase PyrR [Saprospiraceae bacterium]|nr:bifunctional pyr operon transcriptional regulator/uracil phosphoribosyltransferase PyrR [Saprospiraceae bacterium]MBK8449781.1 bifunctional pyr operon transcriptional regulator/uracil phosphoribosyltransferase PyrR [Saprospiraceae bacterium]MBK8484156.1 bifunctional pyr operon transcriptional regulator/uracil phosphoribosyltransferase PyrR [Saprospiraceae bacterium]MBK9221559.1 bifunctional pyr operon transcriptional regulator/uracil phosphoribosyltransferase PyrR [Saprospiraceae bacterium]M